jgi:DNA polymerase
VTGRSLDDLAAEAAGCRACPLYARATQTVFGEGAATADLVLVGEQPGDREDLEGHPFVGPAGRVLDEALEAAGIDRSAVYVTNAVKHFKWQPRGKRRIRRRWLDAELEALGPAVVVALGATAGQALWGSSFRVGAARGQVLELEGRPAVATIHPSAVLRARGSGDGADDLFADLVEGLRRASGIRPRARSTAAPGPGRAAGGARRR